MLMLMLSFAIDNLAAKGLYDSLAVSVFREYRMKLPFVERESDEGEAEDERRKEE